MMPLLLIATTVVCVMRLCGHKDVLFKDAAHMLVAGLIGALLVAALAYGKFKDLVEGSDPCDRWALPGLRRSVGIWRLWCYFLAAQVAVLILTESFAALCGL